MGMDKKYPAQQKSLGFKCEKKSPPDLSVLKFFTA